MKKIIVHKIVLKSDYISLKSLIIFYFKINLCETSDEKGLTIHLLNDTKKQRKNTKKTPRESIKIFPDKKKSFYMVANNIKIFTNLKNNDRLSIEKISLKYEKVLRNNFKNHF